jgi:hypothetical protein
MKNRLFTYAILILFFAPALAAGQDLADYCHVYVIDVKAAEKAAMKYPTGNDQQDLKLLTTAITIVGRFAPEIAEEQPTVKTYRLPGSTQVITAGVVYTDESLYSTKSKTPNSMLAVIAVSKKALDDPLNAPNNATAEITYTDHTDIIRVKTQAYVRGRQYLVGLECRCNREFDESDPKNQAK